MDVQPDRLAPGLACALVGRLHNAGTAAGDDAETSIYQKFGDFFRILVFLRFGGAACRAENGDAVDLERIEGVQGFYHFGHDAEGTPGFSGHGGEIVHDILLQFRHGYSFCIFRYSRQRGLRPVSRPGRKRMNVPCRPQAAAV